jgi:hypothetical protein
MQGTTCATELDVAKPVGGTNWAVEISMSPNAPALAPGAKDKADPESTITVFFIPTTNNAPGNSIAIGPFGGETAKQQLTIVSVDAHSVTFKYDGSGPSGNGKDTNSVRGQVTAEICPQAQ